MRLSYHPKGALGGGQAEAEAPPPPPPPLAVTFLASIPMPKEETVGGSVHLPNPVAREVHPGAVILTGPMLSLQEWIPTQTSAEIK
jgi:hypothetical protein